MGIKEITLLAESIQAEFGFSAEMCKSLALRLKKEGQTGVTGEMREKVSILQNVYGPEKFRRLSTAGVKEIWIVLTDAMKLSVAELKEKADLWKEFYGAMECEWGPQWEMPAEELREKLVWWTGVRGTEEYDIRSDVFCQPLTELKKRYELAVQAVGKENIRGNDLIMTAEEDAGYQEVLDGIGLSREEKAGVMKIVLGDLAGRFSGARPAKNAAYLIDALTRFGISEEERKIFVCESAKDIFLCPDGDAAWDGPDRLNDQVDWIFDNICDEYGTEEGFRQLKENPSVLTSDYQFEKNCFWSYCGLERV